MNPWLRDPRIVQAAEVDAFQAERAERRGELRKARALYCDAAEAFAAVAIEVPSDYPNTRRDLADAALTCLSRCQALDAAIVASLPTRGARVRAQVRLGFARAPWSAVRIALASALFGWLG